MCASGWPITLLLFCLLDSATSSPVSMYTPAPPLPLHISPPSPAIISSLPSPSLSTLHPTPPLVSNSGESTEIVKCSITISPSTLVVRFGDPVTANCSVQTKFFSGLGWLDQELQQNINFTMERFVIWSVDRITNWTLEPTCFALSEVGGNCHIKLPLIVYKPPDNVSISFGNHTGPMFEGHQYTLQCTVHDVAPVENLIVTFYRGQTTLGKLQLNNNNTTKEPVTDIYTFIINPNKNDDGVQYWCEAKLELGSEGPQHPQVVKSHKITASVLFGPQLVCPPKLQVREGESLSCEVRGNPQPSVTWYRDGQVVSLPTHSSRTHAGKYIVLAQGLHEQRNFTVEVEVLSGSGMANNCNRYFLLAVLLIQMINWL